MLVLSRRANQKVLFPNLGITVEIVGVKGNNVKLGIDAPPEIRILRSELVEEQEESGNTKLNQSNQNEASLKRHQRNNQLNSIGLQIQIAQKLMKRGDQNRAMEVLEGSLTKLQTLDGQTTLPGTNSEHSGGSKKALLVEDDENERQLMSTILEMCGFEVDAVEDGLAAIEYLRTQPRPDCVLMDMQMPRLSGPEAITKIRQQVEFAGVPIYGVSGLPRKEAGVPMGDRGVTDWFAKPVDAKKLVQRIFHDTQPDASSADAMLN